MIRCQPTLVRPDTGDAIATTLKRLNLRIEPELHTLPSAVIRYRKRKFPAIAALLVRKKDPSFQRVDHRPQTRHPRQAIASVHHLKVQPPDPLGLAVQRRRVQHLGFRINLEAASGAAVVSNPSLHLKIIQCRGTIER